jgi:DHA1 family multidrug resistance protein-like MFS transporter
LFAPPMLRGMGVRGGVGFLAGLTVLCWIGLFVLFWYGATLRARSRFALS